MTGKRVLWVDEQQNLWLALADQIRSHDITVVSALSAAEGLRLLSQEWDAVILDVIAARGGAIDCPDEATGLWLLSRMTAAQQQKTVFFTVVPFSDAIDHCECAIPEERYFRKGVASDWRKLVTLVARMATPECNPAR